MARRACLLYSKCLLNKWLFKLKIGLPKPNPKNPPPKTNPLKNQHTKTQEFTIFDL